MAFFAFADGPNGFSFADKRALIFGGNFAKTDRSDSQNKVFTLFFVALVEAKADVNVLESNAAPPANNALDLISTYS